MEQQKDINRLLQNYFQQEQQKENSRQLQKRIAMQTASKSIFTWRGLALPIAASLLLIIGFSVWSSKQQLKNRQLAQENIVYEDNDLLIYIKDE